MAKIYKSKVIVLRKKKFKESSIILDVLSKNEGIFSALVFGGISKNSNFTGKTELFSEIECVYYKKENSLDIIKEIIVLQDFNNISLYYNNLLTASYFIKLVERSCERETPLPKFYSLLQKAFLYLSKNQSSIKLIYRFERRILSHHGFTSNNIDENLSHLAEMIGFVPKEREVLLSSI